MLQYMDGSGTAVAKPSSSREATSIQKAGARGPTTWDAGQGRGLWKQLILQRLQICD